MKTTTTKPAANVAEGDVFLGKNWFDPLEAGVRTRIRGVIEGLLEAELDAALARKRYERPSLAETESAAKAAGHRHGHRARQLMGTFGPVVRQRSFFPSQSGRRCQALLLLDRNGHSPTANPKGSPNCRSR
jgi:hypothetical protein